MSADDWNYPAEGGLDPTLAMVPYLVAYQQDIARRLNLGLGRLWYDPLFGIYANGIRDVLNESGITTAEVARDIAVCIRHDQRTATVRVDIPPPLPTANGGMRWIITIRAEHRQGGSVVIPLVVEG